MDKEFEYAKQEIIEFAEQYCGGFVKDYKHGLEKIRNFFIDYNLGSQSQRSFNSNNIRSSFNTNKKKDNLPDVDIEELRLELKKSRKIILTLQEKISIIPQLQNELKEYEKKIAMEISKVTNKYQNDMAQCSKEMKQYNKLAAINSQLEQKNKLLTLEIESYRRHHKEIGSDGKMTQFQELAASRSKEIQKLEISCNRLKVKIELKNQEIEKLTNKILILEQNTEQIKKEKKTPQNEKTETIESGSSLVKYYKKKLEEKDLELKKLNKRVNKMHRIEIQCKIKEEGFENERKEYMDRIGELCKNNSNMEKIINQKIPKQILAKEEPKKREKMFEANYENMMELARSTAEAYNTLVSNGKMSNRSARPTTAGNESKHSHRPYSAYKFS
jgi:chromosome segregation ATPase